MLSSVWFWIWMPFSVLSIAFLWRALWEPRHLQVTYRIIPSDAAAAEPLRLALLSDLHAEHFYLDMQKLIEAMLQAKPDAIVFSGDLIGDPRHLPKGLSLLRQIRKHPELGSLPFWAVMGNHDHEQVATGLESLGITVLQNDSLYTCIRGSLWQIIGLEDLRSGFPDFPAAVWRRGKPLAASQRIVVAHNPDTLHYLPDKSAALVLSGHFHGGQIWTPFRLEFLMLRQEKLPRAGMTRGLHHQRGLNLYISRGLGCVSLPLRFMSRPELAILQINGRDSMKLNGGET